MRHGVILDLSQQFLVALLIPLLTFHLVLLDVKSVNVENAGGILAGTCGAVHRRLKEIVQRPSSLDLILGQLDF